jgi:hypothetical protein
MQFEGDQLISILRQQVHEVQIRNQASYRVGTVSKDRAMQIAQAGNFVGIGHAKRILYLRPMEPEFHLHQNTVRRIRNERGEIVAPKLHVEHRWTNEGGRVIAAHPFRPKPQRCI